VGTCHCSRYECDRYQGGEALEQQREARATPILPVSRHRKSSRQLQAAMATFVAAPNTKNSAACGTTTAALSEDTPADCSRHFFRLAPKNPRRKSDVPSEILEEGEPEPCPQGLGAFPDGV